MKKITVSILLLFIITLETNISIAQSVSHFKSLQWLTGIWLLESKNEKSYEEWKFVSDSLLKGRSFNISGKDTIVNELISIIKTRDGVFYKAEVNNHNNGEVVYFKLISQTYNSLVFENKTHDFPKIIKYNLWNKKNLSATIESDTIKHEFRMKKIK